MLDEKTVLQELSKIIDPDFNRDIVSLGFVQNVKIDKSNISFTIELTTPACPYSPVFKKQAIELIEPIANQRKISVNMTSRSGRSNKIKTENSGLQKVKFILAVSSCKGGVGKSTISALLAKTLASRGIKVGLLDADIYGPSIPTLFNIHEPGVKATNNNKFYPKISDGVELMSFGFLMGDKPAVIRGPMVAQYMQQLLHNVIWSDLDYLIIDMPPGTGDIQLTICQSVQIDGSVIITTPHQLSLTDVKKGIMMFEKVNVPVLGVIENMSYFECPDNLKKYFIFGENKLTLNERFGLDTLIQLPISQELGSSYNELSKTVIATKTTDSVIRSLGKKVLEKPLPPKIHFDQKNIYLKWSNSDYISISNLILRKSCNCALCVDEMTQQPILNHESIPKDIFAKDVSLIGNYAILVDWSDGHNTGFFPFSSIRRLAEKENSQ